jgi:hypothetical protein
MKVYLDNCCFNRPYDDQEQIRVRLESEAKLEIQSRIKEGRIKLVWSFMLDFENGQNRDYIKNKEIGKWASIAVEYFLPSLQTGILASKIMQTGIKNKDAVHIVCAVESACDFFLTTDDGILKRKEKISEITIINPVDFILLMESES